MQLLNLLCLVTCVTAIPMMKMADKVSKGFITASAATGTIGALLSVNQRWSSRDADGQYQDLGALGSMACGFAVGSTVPLAAVNSVYGLVKAGGAIYLFPKGDYANKIRVYRQLNDNTVRGWNGQRWVDVSFDAKQCADSFALKYGFKGQRFNFTHPEINKNLEASRTGT